MTQHEYERYRNRLTGEGPDPKHLLRWAIVLTVLALACLYPVWCQAQSVEQGGIAVGPSRQHTPRDGAIRPASSATFSLEQDGTAARSDVTAPRQLTPARPAPKSFLLAALTYAGLQAVDFGQTTIALKSGRYREANGALAGIAGSPWKLALVKGAVTSGTIAGAWSLRKTHPRAAKWVLVGAIGAQSAVVGWNWRQMR